MKQEEICIFVDGSGADPNGVAGFAWFREGQKPHVEWGQGWTNNEAEYRAVLSAMQTLQHGARATVLCDSALVIRQLRGEYAVREPRLCDLHHEVEIVIAENDLQVSWSWIPRKENKADRLLRQKPKQAEQPMREQNNEQTEITNEGALSVSVAARYLGVRVGTLYAWIYREKIPAFRLHGRWKLSRTSLESTKGLKHGRSATSD